MTTNRRGLRECRRATSSAQFGDCSDLAGPRPEGGGAAAAAGKAFGEGWAFVPIGALIVDFVFMIATSVAAGASALIDHVPGLAPARISLALVLLVVVAGLSWFGHLGRAIFAAMTLAFVAGGVSVLVGGLDGRVADVGRITHSSAQPTLYG